MLLLKSKEPFLYINFIILETKMEAFIHYPMQLNYYQCTITSYATNLSEVTVRDQIEFNLSW